MLETLFTITELFKSNRIGYCLIGGLAMMLYHGRANTVDLDFYVLVKDLKTVRQLFEKKNYKVRDAGQDQLKAKVGSVPIDILRADVYAGADAVKRSVPKRLVGHTVHIATPEDLIILKTIANRSIDRRDIEELRELFGKTLDEKYIKRKLGQLHKILNKN